MSAETASRARRAAAVQYANAFDHWAEQEQLLRLEGRAVEVEGAHEMARIALRAWGAEVRDPKPREATA